MPSPTRGFSPSLLGRALRCLAQREYSRVELERKLAPHAESPEKLAQTLDELQAKGFINEARVAQSLLNRRAALMGNARLRQELIHKGLDKETVSQALQGMQETELDRAKAVWERKFGEPAVDAAGRAKQIRFLTARGFAAEVVRRVVEWTGE